MPSLSDFEILFVGCKAKEERLPSSHRGSSGTVISRAAEGGKQLQELVAMVFLSQRGTLLHGNFYFSPELPF